MTTTVGAPPDSAVKSTGLRANTVGFPTVLAQSAAVISPTAVLIIPLVFAGSGRGTWLTYLFATIMLLLVVSCLNQFARRSAAPGSMYSHNGRVTRRRPGILADIATDLERTEPPTPTMLAPIEEELDPEAGLGIATPVSIDPAPVAAMVEPARAF